MQGTIGRSGHTVEKRRLWLSAGNSVQITGLLATFPSLISGATATSLVDAENAFWKWVVPGYSKSHKAGSGKCRGLLILQIVQATMTIAPIIPTMPAAGRRGPTLINVIATPSTTMTSAISIIPMMPAISQTDSGKRSHILRKGNLVLAGQEQHKVIQRALSQSEQLRMTGGKSKAWGMTFLLKY